MKIFHSPLATPYVRFGVALFFASLPSLKAAVPSADVTLQPVITTNIPVVASLVAYGANESGATAANKQVPLYTPYDSTQDGWWDNLVAEQLQERIPVVQLETTGTFTTNPVDLVNCPGGAYGCNPAKLGRYIRALQRAGATTQIKLACFYQGAVASVYNRYYGTTTPVDFSNADSWDKVWWQRVIKPWFATVPPQYWYPGGGKVLIEFWGLGGAPTYSNPQGNVSQMLAYIAGQLQAEYNVTPIFIMGGLSYDTTLQTSPYLYGNDAWYGTPNRPYTMTALLGTGRVIGCMVPGATAPNYYTVGDPNYMNPNNILYRNGIAGTGQNGDTLKLGLDAMVSSNAVFTDIEGYMDYSESCGIYRSRDADWDYPNQYLNLVQRYTDLRTVTLRLEAEGCDEYADTTTGNSGGAFLRSDESLDVRALAGAASASSNAPFTTQTPAMAFDGDLTNKWNTAQVPSAAAPVWLQYDYGSGNSDIVNGYSITSANDVPQRDPQNWQFQGSSNGTTWVTLDTQASQTFAARAQTNSYTFTNGTAYRYYRLNITANAGGGTYGLQLADLMLNVSQSYGGGWAVTNTAAGEWIQFDDVNFSAGNYKFPVRYASAASHQLQLVVDGTALPAVTLPSSGGTSAFTTAYLGTKAMSHGPHTLRVLFVDGGIDLDWLFIKKYDSLVSLHSGLTGCYVTAESAGNATVVSTRTTEGSWERFSIDDPVGAGTVSHGDVINLQTCNGLYLTASGGGGSALQAKVRTPGIWEKFTVVRAAGAGPLATGDQVALKSYDGSHYLTVVSATTVDCSGTSIGTAQLFTVNLTAQ